MRKKFHVCMWAALAVLLMAGCGKQTEERAAEPEEIVENTAVTNNHATPEMDLENEKDRENVWKKPADVTEPAEPEQVLLSPEDLREPEIAEQEVTEIVPNEHAVNKLQIVFLGDSILDGYRNDTGIASLTGVYCNADVYNLAMGGTTAALLEDESAAYEEWTSRSLQGVVNVICGNVDRGLLDGYRAGEVFDSCNFENTDYFVLEYGMNDFLSCVPLSGDDSFYDPFTYVGALRIAVQALRDKYPDAQIILCSPNYAHFWGQDGAYLGDGNMSSNGVANLVEYHRVCGNVANDMKTLFMNVYEGIGLDAYTADEYLEDGIHLSEKGRDEYAKKLSKIILEFEATRNN